MNLFRLDFDVTTSWLVAGVCQGTNFGMDGLQIRRRGKSHLNFVHWYFCNFKIVIIQVPFLNVNYISDITSSAGNSFLKISSKKTLWVSAIFI